MSVAAVGRLCHPRQMGRVPRDAVAGTHHVTTLAIAGAPLFADPFDFHRRLAILAEATCDCFSINQFCLMDNHEHLVVTVSDGVLSSVMRDMNRAYAGWFNTRHGRKGHVFGAPFSSVRIVDERHALSVVRYVALNPDGARYTAESYPYSSYRSLIEGTWTFPFVDVEPLLAWFGGGEKARRRIANFV